MVDSPNLDCMVIARTGYAFGLSSVDADDEASVSYAAAFTSTNGLFGSANSSGDSIDRPARRPVGRRHPIQLLTAPCEASDSLDVQIKAQPINIRRERRKDGRTDGGHRRGRIQFGG
jgi:hypothetical protein